MAKNLKNIPKMRNDEKPSTPLNQSYDKHKNLVKTR